jgi:hypothetical protein
MTTKTLSAKKLKRIARINGVVKEYFNRHPAIDQIAATHLMPLLIRKGIFLKDVEDALPLRSLLRELYKGEQLFLLEDANVVIVKRIYYFYRKKKVT